MKNIVINTIWAALFYSSFRKSLNSLDIREIFIIIFALIFIKSHTPGYPLLFISFLSLDSNLALIDLINILFLLKFDIIQELSTTISIIIAEKALVVRCILITIFFILLEIFFILFFDKNTRRKNIHVACFFIFIQYNKLIVELSNYLILISTCICRTTLIERFARPLLNDLNCKRDRYSHLFLLCSLSFPYYFLNKTEYIRSIISVCIMDSGASLVGSTFKKRRKTIMGLVFGQTVAYLAEYFIYNSINFRYHLFVGLVEYFCPINDNLAIPFLGTFYQICERQGKIRSKSNI